MPEPIVDRDPVEFLAAEFVDRLREGERPTIEEYTAAHPEWADQIRDLFPTIAAMENLKLDKEVSSGGRASLGPTKIERLGDLRIIREIGRGGMGIVYEAEQESLGRRVAVKVLPKQSLLDEKHLRRFRREARTAAKLHHTNIVPILGVGEQDGFHYYVMQIIRGAGFDEIIPQLNNLTKASSIEATPVPRARRAANVSSVARALVNGELRSLAKANDSWGSSNGSSIESTSGTDNNRAAITTAAPDEGTAIYVDESFELAGDIETMSVDDEGAAPESAGAATSTSRFGMAYWQSVARIGVQVANALNYAHRQGTLHRDIKPANLLIDEGGIVWVADFGLAKAMEQDNVSRTGDIVGTLRYMAPEQFLGEADARSDIYSLGLTLYELLTLKPAFDETQRKRSLLHESGTLEPVHPRRDNPSIPRDLETIVLKAIAAEPVSRYQTAAELSEDLQRFLQDRPIHARRASIAERLRRWARRNPAVASLTGIAISLLMLVAIVSTSAFFSTKHAMETAVTAEASERIQRLKAEATSELAWDALDKIFERLAPHRYVSPEDFAVETEETAEFNVNTQPVISDEAAALLDEMLVFYRKLAAQGDDTDEFRQRIAEANRRVGDIRQRLGQLGQAKKAYGQAITVYSQLEDGGKMNPRQVAALASIYNELGQVHRKSRQYDQARDAFDKAKDILEPVATKSSPPEVRYELARSFYLRVHQFDGRSQGRGTKNGGGSRGSGKGGPSRRPGEVFQPGDGARRMSEFRRDSEKIERAVALLEDLTEEYKVPDYQQLLALCYAERHRRLRFEDRGKSEEAIAKAITLLEDLVDEYPQNPDYRFTLSKIYTQGLRGFGKPSQTELAELEARLLTAIDLLEDLHREHPGVPDYVLSQLGVRRGLVFAYTESSRIEDAQLNFHESIRLQELLSETESIGSGIDPRIGFLLVQYSSVLVEHSRKAKKANEDPHPEWLVEVREQFDAWIEMMNSVAKSDPRQLKFVGYAYRRLATINTELGDAKAAAVATENMKTLLPEEEWEDVFQRDGRWSPGGPRDPKHRQHPPGPERTSPAVETGNE